MATCLAVLGSIIAGPGAAWAVPVPWQNCGTPGDAVSIQQFDASVWPPQGGRPLTLSSRWTLSETLAVGSLEHLTTTWPSGRVSDTWLPFQPPVTVLFDDALLGHRHVEATPLPIPAGPYNQSLTVRVPRKGQATQPLAVDLTGVDAGGSQVLCLRLVIPVK